MPLEVLVRPEGDADDLEPVVGKREPAGIGLDQRHPEDCGPDEDLLVFADGTPTSVYDDGNWKTTRADRPHRR